MGLWNQAADVQILALLTQTVGGPGRVTNLPYGSAAPSAPWA